MATTTFTTMIPTPSKNVVAKKPGPPVPPRPQQSSLYRMQRDAGSMATATAQRSSSKVGLEQHQMLKKPTLTHVNSASTPPTTSNAVTAGRTIIYKSPSLNLPKRQEEREKRGETPTTKTNAVTQTTTRLANSTQATKPPLKLRKAPDVPTLKTPRTAAATEVPPTNANDPNNSNNGNNVVIVQSSQSAVTLNRHHSMNTPSHTKPNPNLKDTRLSLGRADFERVGKIHLDQLQPTSQPLPRPRKIVKIPVATLDVDDTNSNSTTSSTTSSSHTSTSLGANLFKRSKTTLDNFTSRSHITTVTTGHAGGFLTGKTVEIKNNLKNAAERLFSEIMVNQQKHNGTDSAASSATTATNTIITKHERAIQHQTVLETGTSDPQQSSPLPHHNVTVVNTNNEDNCTRINITATSSSPPEASPASNVNDEPKQQAQREQQHAVGLRQVVSAFNSPEKKSAAFHEMLISELAAMRTRSCSMENLQTKPRQPSIHNQFTATESLAHSPATEIRSVSKRHEEQSNADDDIDADNIDDADDDEGDDNDINHVLKKSLKVITSSAQNTTRKRTPSGCSSDSSPYGTERSSRIRTSDWIEVGDNGKQVTLTSCHISLEDSGMEDEERMDEMSSSGVGDSWDSVKEAEQQQHHHQQQQQQQQQQQAKRSRSVKRIMSINDLPPLPKSLSGINKMLASDSGLISDVDTEMAKNAKNMETKQMENQKENTISSNHNNNSNNNNINNIIKDTNYKLVVAAATMTTGSAATTAAGGATTTTTTPLKEINGNETISEIPPAIPGSKLDNQIATLRKEMFGLRQLDLSLLSQLWALNDSIQEFRTMIQEHEQEDDETYSTHSRSPSPYDSVSSDGDDEISALKGKKLMDLQNANVITSQPKLNQPSHSPENESSKLTMPNKSATLPVDTTSSHVEQKCQLIKPPLPKPLDVKPVPRMRSAPPPPPTHRKSQNAPPRPT